MYFSLLLCHQFMYVTFTFYSCLKKMDLLNEIGAPSKHEPGILSHSRSPT
jgi:hypothetical protein